jgi:xanthine dehydrogenase accessory factor
MLCGGEVDVYLQYIRGGDEQAAALFRECRARLESRDEDLWLLIDLTAPDAWTMALCGPDLPLTGMDLDQAALTALCRNKAALRETGGRLIYGEPVNFAGTVFVFGAGHVAQALAPVLASTGFRYAVFDSRAEFLDPGLFPGASNLVLGDFERIDETLHITANDYIVIITHARDLAVLRQLVSRPWAYLGVIGSANKVAEVRRRLMAEGVSEAEFSRMNAPIGLKIRSETPEEIAVSIAAELILRRAERRDPRC